MIPPILQRENPILRQKAKIVAKEDLNTPEFKKILADMKMALDSQSDGIAIAAPQIGASVRVFLVSGKVLKQADPSLNHDGSDLYFINPKILKLSREKKEIEEGCLSVRWYFGMVKRSTKATISAWNEKGEKIERGAGGILAQVFQHETDHLEGVLFSDHADELWEMTEEEISEVTKNSKS